MVAIRAWPLRLAAARRITLEPNIRTLDSCCPRAPPSGVGGACALQVINRLARSHLPNGGLAWQKRGILLNNERNVERAVRSTVSVMVGLSVALVAAAVRAQPVGEAVRFQYVAPAECPDARSFEARVRERTTRGRAAEAGELARTFALRLRADEAGFLGTIEFLGDTGAAVSRQVRGEQCDAVVSSLALITALALDATLDEPQPESVAVETSRAPPVADAAPRPASSAPERAPAAPPPPPRRRAERLGTRLGASGEFSTAIDAWTYGWLGQIDWRSGWAFRVVAHYATDERLVDPGRRARLRLLGLRGSGCFTLFRGEIVSLAPCLGLDFGSLRGRGIESEALPHASSDTVPWVAAGPELRLAWEPAPGFWLELNGRAEFPLTAYEFKFEPPRKTVYEMPRVAGALGLVTGVRFW